MEAIDALNEKNGSNKSALSKYLEARYNDLPPSHASLLTAHLARLRETGELVFLKNNYFRPGPNSPPKRGRGRPPKPKPAPTLGEEAPSPRPRGRPPKPKDSLSVSVTKVTSGIPRPRGRPPKSAASRPAASVPVATGGVVKRGRGRPPKVKPTAEPALMELRGQWWRLESACKLCGAVCSFLLYVKSLTKTVAVLPSLFSSRATLHANYCILFSQRGTALRNGRTV
ncbi:hypothetical protein ZIOFF_006830 [Zingiber officinale]|uniref:H15 domain-containing protein n=1 Tax=Zingiber officinale TaxID=94328 RepID=A0A8J5HZX4_ZINOF|nr:hypothetical protein ZIOFF_006830 [Zingiber officinale]